MRNLKRVLSLALALVMVLGMMVITTSAATYADADEITYTEAVDVMTVLGIINGATAADGTTAFNPKDTLTREGAAKLITYLLMGADKADKLVGSGNFDDVAADRWSAGSIDYCVSLGYIQGVGNNKFDPKGDMTVLGFGKLLLCALGYDAAIEGYTGTDWATNITTDMIEAGLEVKGVAFDDVLTREIAAEMMLIALETPTVYYNGGKGTNITLADGTKVVVGAGTLTKTAGAGANNPNYDGTNTDTYYELVEKLYPTLVYTQTTNTTFMRPAYEWAYTKNNTVSKVLVADEADKVYTTAVKASQIYADLGLTATSVTPSTALNGTPNQQVTSAQNSAVVNLTKTGTDTYGGNGIVTEVYKINSTTVTVVQTQYTLGYVNNVVSYPATAVKGAYTTYTIDTVSATNNVYVDSNSLAFTGVVFSSVVNKTNDVDTVKIDGTIAKGDYVLVVQDACKNNFAYVYPVTTATGNLTASSATTYTIGGTAYTAADVIVENSQPGAFANALYSTTTPVTVVVDSYGNVIAPIQGASAAPNYFYVVTSEDAHSLIGTTLTASVTATVVDAAGETKTISVSKIGSDAIDGTTYKASNVGAGLYSYKLAKDGVTYELTAVAQNVDGTFEYKTGDLLAANIYGNDNTVFYTIKTATVGGKTVVKSVAKTVGMAAMGDVDNAVGSYVKNAQSVATIVFLTTADTAAVDQVVYYNGAYSYDGTEYTYSVNSDGVDTTLVDTTGWNGKGLYTIDGSTNVASAVDTASTFGSHTGVYTDSGKTYGLIYNGGLLSVVETVVSTGVATTTANIDTIGAAVPVYVYTAATGACTVSTAAEMAVSGASLIYIAANYNSSAIGAIYVIV